MDFIRVTITNYYNYIINKNVQEFFNGSISGRNKQYNIFFNILPNIMQIATDIYTKIFSYTIL